MADISVIKMPDNSSYNLKDAAARQSIAALPTDVQVNGTSVVSSNVANIPIAGANTFGVIKASSNVTGLGINNEGYLYISPPTKAELKAGTDTEHPVTSSKIKEATFYGLAKAANDSTQASSSNAVGKYTDAAKHAIQKMLGITSLFANEESSTATAAHDVNSLFMMDGKLHQATSAIAVGDAVATGTNCTVVKADEVFVKNTDYATTNTAGIARFSSTSGFIIGLNGSVFLSPANSQEIQEGNLTYKTIVPKMLDKAVFFGLSKLAGVDLANETVTVGTYPSTAATAIKSMLQVQEGLEVVKLI